MFIKYLPVEEMNSHFEQNQAWCFSLFPLFMVSVAALHVAY